MSTLKHVLRIIIRQSKMRSYVTLSFVALRYVNCASIPSTVSSFALWL